MGKDREYLEQLKEALIRFDACLWRTRDVSGDGLLSSFCVYDTGEDLAVRYGDAPCWWEEDEPPEGYGVVPMASMDVTSDELELRGASRGGRDLPHSGRSGFYGLGKEGGRRGGCPAQATVGCQARRTV